MDLDKPEIKSPMLQEEEKVPAETLNMDSSSLFNQMADVMIVPPSSRDADSSDSASEGFNPYLEAAKDVTGTDEL